MHRFVQAVALGATLLVGASPALAHMCPKLIKQIEDATAIRYDPTASAAKVAAKEAADLHAAGKHDESIKKAQDALATLGIK